MKKDYISLAPLVQWSREERPLNWEKIFGRLTHMDLEIGFGLGDFLVRTAVRSPDRDIVGVETGWVGVRRALRKIARAHIKNVKLIQADADFALRRLFREESIDRIFSLFPCPWPKRKHIKHRLFSRDFLRLANSRLVMGGRVSIVTDHEGFFEWVLSQVPGTGFELKREMVGPCFNTKYERKWRDQGQEEFFQAFMTKKSHKSVPVEEDIRVKTYQMDHFDPEAFQLENHTGEIRVEFKSFLFDPRKQIGMVRCAAVEEGLFQEFWIEIIQKGDRWHIRPAKGCNFIPTSGVQMALDLVRENVKGR